MSSVTLQEYLKKNSGIDGYISFIATDACWLRKWPLNESFDWDASEEKIREIRIFNQDEEMKLYRGTVDNQLHERHISDKAVGSQAKTAIYYRDHFDEKQYLAYYEEKRCPSSGNRLMLKVRYYFKQDPVTSRAYIVDWRAVCVEES